MEACTAPPGATRGTASPSLAGAAAASAQRMGGNGPRAGIHPCHFTPLAAGPRLQRSGGPGTAEKARDTGPGRGARGLANKTRPPQGRAEAAQQSPAEICKLITAPGNLGGDTTQDASCSTEIREFPGSHLPRGTTELAGAWRNVGKMPARANSAGKLGSTSPARGGTWGPGGGPHAELGPWHPLLIPETALRPTCTPILPLTGCGVPGN